MNQRQVEVNIPVVIPFIGSAPNLTVIPDLTVVKDGIIISTLTVTLTNLNVSNLYTITFTPNVTGIYDIYAFGSILAEVEVVSKGVGRILNDLADCSLGSWQWDKTGGGLTLLRQDGTGLATFTVIDTLTAASRERLT